MFKKSFRIMSLSLLALATIGCSNQADSSQNKLQRAAIAADVETICTQVPQLYAFFAARADHWDETCQRAKKEVLSLKNPEGDLTVFERMIDDLYEPHMALNTNNQDSPRLVPTSADIWFENIAGGYFASAVRPHSGAAKAGIKPGDQLLRFNGLDPKALALTRIHAGADSANDQRLTWAINAAVAGRRSEPRNVEIKRGDAVLSFELGDPDVRPPIALVTSRTITGDVGYIRLNNSLGNSKSAEAFDKALEGLRDTKGLIIDLRETPNGGSTDVAEPIMGRFVDEKKPYQRTVFPDGSSEVHDIKPTGSWTYDKPLVVLVGRWTGSMGEGMAVGFDAMSRAKVMGSQMAGLGGGIESFPLEETGIDFALPTYDLLHLNGTRRPDWRPSDIDIADNGAGEDLLLRKAIAELNDIDGLPSK